MPPVAQSSRYKTCCTQREIEISIKCRKRKAFNTCKHIDEEIEPIASDKGINFQAKRANDRDVVNRNTYSKYPERWSSVPPFEMCQALCNDMIKSHWTHATLTEKSLSLLWLKIKRGRATVGELAYGHALLALVGVTIQRSGNHTITREAQRHHFGVAEEIIHQCGQVIKPLRKAQVLLLLAIYWYDQQALPQARQYLLECVQVTRSIPDFLSSPADDITVSGRSERRLKVIRTLRIDLLAVDVYVALLWPTTTVFATLALVEEELSTFTSMPHRSLEEQSVDEWQYGRLIGLQLALKVTTLLSSDTKKEEAINEQQREKNALAAHSLDADMINFIQAPFNFTGMLNQVMEKGIQSQIDARCVHMAIVNRCVALYLRCFLIQHYASKGNLQLWNIVLESAYDIICWLPISVRLLHSRWHSVLQVCPINAYIEGACYALFPWLNRLGLQSSSIASSITNQAFQDAKAQHIVRKFTQNFPIVFDLLNHTKMLGPWALQCAGALKKIPVQRSNTIIVPTTQQLLHWSNAEDEKTLIQRKKEKKLQTLESEHIFSLPGLKGMNFAVRRLWGTELLDVRETLP